MAKLKTRARPTGSSLPTTVLLVGGAVAVLCTAAYFTMSASLPPAKQPPPPQVARTTLHSLTATKIDGTALDLAALAGKAALVVNVASS